MEVDLASNSFYGSNNTFSCILAAIIRNASGIKSDFYEEVRQAGKGFSVFHMRAQTRYVSARQKNRTAKLFYRFAAGADVDSAITILREIR